MSFEKQHWITTINEPNANTHPQTIRISSMGTGSAAILVKFVMCSICVDMFLEKNFNKQFGDIIEFFEAQR